MMMIFPVANVICVELVLIVISLNSYKTTEAANFKNGKNFKILFWIMDWYSRSTEYLGFFVHQVVSKTIPVFSFHYHHAKRKCRAHETLMLTSDAGTYEEGWLNYNHSINGMCIDVGLSAFQCFFPVTKICFHRTIWKFPVRDQFNCFTLRI